MKFILVVSFLFLLAGCASSNESGSTGAQVSYGGTVQTTITSSHGM